MASTLSLIARIWLLFAAVLQSFGICAGIIGGACVPPTSIITSQADLDSFRADCSEINGSLNIECSDPPLITDVTNLEALRLLSKISGFLRIVGCASLTNLTHLSNLQSVEGRMLATEEGVGDGFAVVISNNNGLTSLNGLQNLTSVGEGTPAPFHSRIYVSGNSNLCHTSTVNWELLLGKSWSRFVYENAGSLCTGDALCSSACTCEHCVGPTADDCQGVCGDGDDLIAVIIVSVVSVLILVATLAIFGYLYVTDRCGIKCQCFSRKVFLGFVPEVGSRSARRSTSVPAWRDTMSTPKGMEDQEVTRFDNHAENGPPNNNFGGVSASSFQARHYDGIRERK